jgi:HSP20 family protein
MATTKETSNQGMQAGSEQNAQQQSDPQSRQGQQLQGSAQGGAVQQRGQHAPAYYRDPFAMLDQLSQEMDQLFDSFLYGRPASRRQQQSQLPQMWMPDVEITEQGGELRVCADLPGIPKDKVKVDIHDNMLTIQGERSEERQEGGGEQGYRRSERRYGSFYRAVALPEGVDAEHAQAQMKDGVLEITLPFTAQKKPKKLDIR